MRAPRSTRNGSVPAVEKDHPDLASVILVNGSRRVRQGDAVAESEAGTRANLQLIAGRQRDGQSGRDQRALAWLHGDRVAGSPRSDPCRPRQRWHRMAAAGPRRGASGGQGGESTSDYCAARVLSSASLSGEIEAETLAFACRGSRVCVGGCVFGVAIAFPMRKLGFCRAREHFCSTNDGRFRYLSG